MKSGLFRRILAMAMMAVMLVGDVIPTAAETVSSGDAAVVEDTKPVTDEKTEDTDGDVNPAPVETDDEETADSAEKADTNVSGGDVVVIEEEETPLEDSLEDIVLKKEVNGVVITLTAPAGSLPEDAELWAEEITQTAANQEELAVIDQALEAEAEQKELEVQKYKAFDIKVLVNGTAVQPEDAVTVTFEGDILLPAANEDLTVYHITDNAVANPVGGLNEENTPEMVTDHFSTYVIVVSGDAAADGYQVTVSHYLSEDENKPVAERQKFYKSADFQLDKATLMTVPVQGGEDYTLEKIILKKADGSVIKTIDNVETSDDQVAIEISQDTLVEMYYQPTVNANHMNEVTYFDYSIMSSGIKIVPTEKKYGINWAQQVSFDYNGKHYDKLVYMNGSFGKINPSATWEIIPEVTPKNGDVFKNVICYSSTGEEAFSWDGKVEFQSGSFVYVENVETPYTSTKNAGINSYGIGHETEFLAMGQTGSFHNATLYINKNGTSLNANVNNATNGGNVGSAIIPNLITGLTDDLMNVVMGPGVYEPGYFTVAPLEGKTIYSDRFDLKFNREGHKYILTSSVDNVTGKETLAGKNNADFFPLNDVPYEDTAAAVSAAGGNSESLSKGNAFFGMRYDFTFSIGDYEGPLEYTFVGDDDMWVFVDGHRVLDLGGLHQMYPTAYGTPKESNVVDLWKAVDENGNLLLDAQTEEGKKKVHQVTVLYMERGGWDSTCYMEFTVPHATPLDTVITDKPNGHIEFDKVDEAGNKLEGVVFGLYKTNPDEDKDAAVYKTAASDANGKVAFRELKVGNYYIKEIKTLDGYKLSDAVYEVTVYSDQVSTINGGSVVNEKVELTEVPVTKEWLNADGTKTPGQEAVKVNLYRDGELVTGTEIALNQDNNWSYTYEDLRKFDENGREYIYSVEEIPVPGYEASYEKDQSGRITILNTQMVTEIELEKRDSGNDKGLNDITFKLYNSTEKILKAENLVDTQVTAKKDRKDGYLKFENLSCGTYLLVEEEPLAGYQEAEPWILEVTEVIDAVTKEKTLTVEIYDTVLKGSAYVKNGEAYAAAVIYNDELPKGNLKITKTVDKVDLAYGAPVFTFKITGPEGLVLYRTITFTNESELTKSITVTNIPAGEYTVEELDTLRYTLVAPSFWETKTVSAKETPEFEFTNKLTNDKYYSHSDVLVNSFRMGEDGTVSISKDRQVTEEVEIITEN